jgi:hypothetical protein
VMNNAEVPEENMIADRGRDCRGAEDHRGGRQSEYDRDLRRHFKGMR